MSTSLESSPAWKELQAHYAQVKDLHMRTLFAEDPARFNRFSIQFKDILFDYSKNRVTDQTLRLLLQLAQEADLPARIEAMFTGEKINNTEKRAVLHTALRNQADSPVLVDGEDVMPLIRKVLAKMRDRKSVV